MGSLLEKESRKRGLLPLGEALTPQTAFALIRDMPYRRASNRTPEAIVTEWRGTCSGKHYLLAEVFRELGLQARVFMATHRFTPENTGHMPQELRSLAAQESVPDVHTFLRVSTPEDPAATSLVDATWPASAGPLGMHVNADFVPGSDMVLACDPIEVLEVPNGRDPQAFKEDLIAEFCGESSQVRNQFIVGLAHWLGEST